MGTDGDRQGRVDGTQFLHDARVGRVGKTKTAIFFRYDQTEEAQLLHLIQRHVGQMVFLVDLD